MMLAVGLAESASGNSSRAVPARLSPDDGTLCNIPIPSSQPPITLTLTGSDLRVWLKKRDQLVVRRSDALIRMRLPSSLATLEQLSNKNLELRVADLDGEETSLLHEEPEDLEESVDAEGDVKDNEEHVVLCNFTEHATIQLPLLITDCLPVHNNCYRMVQCSRVSRILIV
ncbi:hypothetical protein V6N13_001584 [Hibiscus sabdariffa]